MLELHTSGECQGEEICDRTGRVSRTGMCQRYAFAMRRESICVCSQSGDAHLWPARLALRTPRLAREIRMGEACSSKSGVRCEMADSKPRSMLAIAGGSAQETAWPAPVRPWRDMRWGPGFRSYCDNPARTSHCPATPAAAETSPCGTTCPHCSCLGARQRGCEKACWKRRFQAGRQPGTGVFTPVDCWTQAFSAAHAEWGGGPRGDLERKGSAANGDAKGCTPPPPEAAAAQKAPRSLWFQPVAVPAGSWRIEMLDGGCESKPWRPSPGCSGLLPKCISSDSGCAKHMDAISAASTG